MNVADSQRVGSALEQLGYIRSETAEKADIIVLNTCVVRQSAEDRAYGRLSSLRPLKESNPNLVINLMGCLVGIKGNELLRRRLPFVDVFSPPSDFGPLIAYLTQGEARKLEADTTARRFAMMDGNLILPAHERGRLVSAHLPVVYGCSHGCTFCVIPYRRGVERSRPTRQILDEAHAMVRQGVKEVTLLGQIVDRYGRDLPEKITLTTLLHHLQEVEGLERIRFLTSHPSYFGEGLMRAVVDLPKVMPHIEIPVQAGDDEVLRQMKRGYTTDDFRRLVASIREHIPAVSIATDIIVGFPGETEKQFMRTHALLAEIEFDVVHLARYSPRPGTLAERRLPDDVPEDEKMHRFRLLEDLQEAIAAERNASYLNQRVDVLFEEQVKSRWRGRSPTNKLVFVESDEDLRGRIVPVRITWTGAWSMQAEVIVH